MRRNPGPSLISATSSQHRNATTGRPMRTTRSSSSLVVVFVRPTRIVRHGRGGEAGSAGSVCTGSSSVRSSPRSAATSDRQRPLAANAVRSSARSHRSTGYSPAQACRSFASTSPVIAFLLFRCRGRALARTASRSADLSDGPSKAPVRPRQRVRINQLRRRTVSGACGPFARSRRPALHRHAMVWIFRAFDGVPQR